MNATDPDFRANLAQADLIHADGQIIVAASRWFGGPQIADRSSTTDMFIDSLKPAADAQVSYYLRSEEHTSELQSLMRISYAVFCLKKKKTTTIQSTHIYRKN